MRKASELLVIGINRQLIKIKDDKIKYPYQKKEYKFNETTPEEIIRAACFVELVVDYKYSPNNINIEVEVPRRSPSDWADMVVYSDDGKKSNYIVIENKKENISQTELHQAIEQGFGNANSLRASFLVIHNFDHKIVYDVQSHPPNERKLNIVNDIPVNYGKEIIYTPQIIKQKQNIPTINDELLKIKLAQEQMKLQRMVAQNQIIQGKINANNKKAEFSQTTALFSVIIFIAVFVFLDHFIGC